MKPHYRLPYLPAEAPDVPSHGAFRHNVCVEQLPNDPGQLPGAPSEDRELTTGDDRPAADRHQYGGP